MNINMQILFMLMGKMKQSKKELLKYIQEQFAKSSMEGKAKYI